MPFANTRFDRILTYFAATGMVSVVAATLWGVSRGHQSDYEPGERFATVEGFDPARSAGTIAIFVNTSCGACQRAAELFQRIARKPRVFQVILVGYEDAESLKHFADTAGISADAVVSVPVGTIRFSAVPALAVIDRRGVVRSTWVEGEELVGSEASILARIVSLGSLGGH